MPSAKPVIVAMATVPITVGIVTLKELKMYWPMGELLKTSA